MSIKLTQEIKALRQIVMPLIERIDALELQVKLLRSAAEVAQTAPKQEIKRPRKTLAVEI